MRPPRGMNSLVTRVISCCHSGETLDLGFKRRGCEFENYRNQDMLELSLEDNSGQGLCVTIRFSLQMGHTSICSKDSYEVYNFFKANLFFALFVEPYDVWLSAGSGLRSWPLFDNLLIDHLVDGLDLDPSISRISGLPPVLVFSTCFEMMNDLARKAESLLLLLNSPGLRVISHPSVILILASFQLPVCLSFISARQPSYISKITFSSCRWRIRGVVRSSDCWIEWLPSI